VEEPHDVTLFDVAADKRGILPPREFLRSFGHVDVPRLLYHGNANEPFLDLVSDGTLEGMTFEGVVCKGGLVSPGRPLMFKWKNWAWLDRLRGLCQGDERLFAELA